MPGRRHHREPAPPIRMGRGRRSRRVPDSDVAPFAVVLRILIRRGYARRIAMPRTRESFSPPAVPDPVSGTGGRDVTELLLSVLRSIEPYEACILEAERDGDFEVAAFLRELRRQDLLRAREATRLLKRSLEAISVHVQEKGASYVELSVGS